MKDLLTALFIIAIIPLSMVYLEPYLGDFAMYVPFLVIALIVLCGVIRDEINKNIAKAKQKEIDKKLLASRPKNRSIPKYEWWLKNIEPRYSSSKTYGPDWGTRREYIAEIYNYKCGSCGKEVPPRTGHVHHVDKLSTSGSNSLDNLVFLCRHCHEDQHPHLKWRKEIRLSEIKRRGITEEQYLKERREEYFEWIALRNELYPQKYSQKPILQQKRFEEKKNSNGTVIPDWEVDKNTKNDFSEIDNW